MARSLVPAGIVALAVDPAGVSAGQTYWNTANKVLRTYDGSVWTNAAAAPAATPAFTATSPAIPADTDWSIKHNLGSFDISVTLRRAVAPRFLVGAYVVLVDSNTVTIPFSVAAAAGEYRVIVRSA